MQFLKVLFQELYNIIYFKFLDKKVKILARNGCLGRDVLSKLGLDYRIISFSRTRVDYAVESYFDKRKVYKPAEACLILKNKVLNFCELKNVFFKSPKPDLLYMDSYSELTQQLFENKSGWQLITHYSELDISEKFNNEFSCCGLLEKELLKQKYFEFFSLARKKYGNIPIIFIHFPTTFDEREKFKERGKTILESIESLTKCFDNLYSISIEDGYVVQYTDGMPYHFSDPTFEEVAKRIKKIDFIKKKLNLPMDYDDIKKWILGKNFQNYINKLALKYKNKKILIYGCGLVFSVIMDNFDLSGLNIIAIIDMRANKEEFFFQGLKVISPNKISEYNPDAILAATYKFYDIYDYIKLNTVEISKKVKIESLINKNFEEKITEYLTSKRWFSY